MPDLIVNTAFQKCSVSEVFTWFGIFQYSRLDRVVHIGRMTLKVPKAASEWQELGISFGSASLLAVRYSRQKRSFDINNSHCVPLWHTRAKRGRRISFNNFAKQTENGQCDRLATDWCAWWTLCGTRSRKKTPTQRPKQMLLFRKKKRKKLVAVLSMCTDA